MRYWTLDEVRQKIESDLDLLEEPDILSPNELVGYLNDAIDTVEQHFIKLGDYFLATTDRIELIEDQAEYDLPEDIYATKIRQILCDDDYVVRQLKDIKKIPLAEDNSGSEYTYMLINNNISGSRPRIRLFPVPKKGDGEYIQVYYTRNATRILSEDDGSQLVDVPEAMLFILCYIKMRIYEKEKNMAMYQSYKEELAEHKQNLMDALAARIDDEDNVIEPDTSLFDEHY
jgi:hypothetical protein